MHLFHAPAVQPAHRRVHPAARCVERRSVESGASRSPLPRLLTRSARHRCAVSSLPAELLQEVERELAPHVAVDLAAGDSAVEPRPARRVHARFNLLDDVHRRGAAEPGDQRARHRVVVLDRAGRRRVGQDSARRVRQRQRFFAVVVRVVEHRHLDAP